MPVRFWGYSRVICSNFCLHCCTLQTPSKAFENSACIIQSLSNFLECSPDIHLQLNYYGVKCLNLVNLVERKSKKCWVDFLLLNTITVIVRIGVTAFDFFDFLHPLNIPAHPTSHQISVRSSILSFWFCQKYPKLHLARPKSTNLH